MGSGSQTRIAAAPAAPVPFEVIVERHGPAILRVCRAILGYADAEDAWSETFLAALVAYPELPPGSNVEAWLVTIAKRKAIDVVRGAARRAIPVDTVPERPVAASDARDLDLIDAMAELPRKQREVVAYHYLIGLPYAQIAPIVGGSVDAARRAGADGIAALRRSYATGTTSEEDPA